MSGLRPTLPVKPVCAVTFNPEIDVPSVLAELEAILGPVEESSPVFDFSSFTSYYDREMGEGLRKQFLSFVELMHPGDLAGLKRKTLIMEERWMGERGRRVNLDPGYITGSKLVLASTKDFAHRIYLDQGIYGDLQLQYRHHRFREEHWTFPDYRSELALAFFNRVRERLVQKEKNEA